MQQHCKTCGFESTEADKFCRNCGAQLLAENEFSSAPTANHGKMESNPHMASVGTGRFPPSVGDAIAGDTSRYYYAPQYAPGPMTPGLPQNVQPPRSIPLSWVKSVSGFFKGFLIFLLFAALLGTTAAAVFFSQEAEQARERSYELNKRAQARSGGNSANGRAQGAWDQMDEALILMQEAAEKAAGAGATLSVNGEKPADLSKYAYPGAQVEATIGGNGGEALSLLTRQNFETLQSFYERQFGKPVIQVADISRGEKSKKLLFQSSGPSAVLIRIEETDEGQVKITILRSLFRFPKIDDGQAQSLK